MLLLTLKFEIPDAVIGLSGIVFIGASIWSSRRANEAEAREAAESIEASEKGSYTV